MLELILIKPEKYKVARVITFKDNFNNLSGTICYMRPLTNSYNKETLDDFDNSMLIWLQSFNLKKCKTHIFNKYYFQQSNFSIK